MPQSRQQKVNEFGTIGFIAGYKAGVDAGRKYPNATRAALVNILKKMLAEDEKNPVVIKRRKNVR